jgi:hypothetical protein
MGRRSVTAKGRVPSGNHAKRATAFSQGAIAPRSLQIGLQQGAGTLSRLRTANRADQDAW